MGQISTRETAERIRGLTDREVQRSRELYGGNTLAEVRKSSFLKEFLRSFGDPIIKILLVALIVNVMIRLRDFSWYESVGIAAAILVSTFVSTLSEFGSESAFQKLQEEALKTTCRVRRSGGLTELPVGDVVVGDYVLLQAGDRVPADGIVFSGELNVDQSSLNGESREVRKAAGAGTAGSGRGVGFDNPERLFRGSVVCAGEAVMLVKNVGGKTFYGGLARDIQEDSRESPLKLRLGRLASTISKFGYIGAAAVAAADLFQSVVLAGNFQLPAILAILTFPKSLFACLVHAATLAISVIVVAIPEGLPLMITIVLSSNMKRMLKDNVLVRKLVGIETSGNLNILFTDKTGTVTRGKLQVTSFLFGDGVCMTDRSKLLKTRAGGLFSVCARYNTAASPGGAKGKSAAIGGNATERALLDFALSGRIGKRENLRVAAAVPFTSAAKYSAARVEGDLNLTLVKGAPELILARCTHYLDAEGRRLPLPARGRLQEKMAELTSSAVRLLAVAVTDEDLSAYGLNRNLTLVGVAGIRDEVRPEAAAAIRQVARAGVQVVIITGDNRDTAAAIAREVGLIRGEEGTVLTSDELRALSDHELKAALPDLRVVARAVPADKSRLVRAAQELGLVTGMTGDGINDAPALKLADVGFAMGSGTEIAKEASDIVILDDNFLSIAKAILYGRTIFKSIRKFIVFQLSINLCAVGISVVGPFIGVSSPITVLQMLWVNMVIDTLAGLAFAGEPPLAEYMEDPPKRMDEPIINAYMYSQILVSGLYTTLLCILFLKLPVIRVMFGRGGDGTTFMTAFFAMFIFAGVFNSFNARTSRLNLLANLWRNKGFLAIMVFVTAVQLVIVYFGGSVFRTAGLTFRELQFVLALAFTVIPVDFLRKAAAGSGNRENAL